MSSIYLLETFNSCIIAIKMSSTHEKQEEKQVMHLSVSSLSYYVPT